MQEFKIVPEDTVLESFEFFDDWFLNILMFKITIVISVWKRKHRDFN